MTVVTPSFNRPQAEFLSRNEKFRAFVGGFGSGKTWVGCGGIAKHCYEFPRVNSGYFAPTYGQIRDIFYPTVEESLHDWGLRTRVRVANHEVEVYRGRVFMGQILCRSMEDPGSIVGFKIGHALTDEIDTMAMPKATDAWRKIIARMRYNVAGLRNGIDVVTTPEGFRFVYGAFVRAVRERPDLAGMYGLVQASTYENEVNLPADYIPSLLASYPPALIDAYINGQFVNLQTGTVYAQYNRKLNGCSDTVQPGEILHIGMDFNVGKMAGIIHVKRNGLPRAVDEIMNGYDTPDMIRKIKERFWTYEGGRYTPSRQIFVYPDASGGSRKSVNASETDIALLKTAGFTVKAPAANPPVKDRINAMNGMFLNSEGERRYLVNADLCPTYADALEQQAWAANGEPDKSTGHDHACFTGETLVQTPEGMVRFDALPESGKVLGPFGGYVPYHSAGKTGQKITVRIDFANGYFIHCTRDHLFLVEDGSWVKAEDLTGRACVSSVTLPKSSKGLSITDVENTLPIPQTKESAVCIKQFGLPTMARSWKGSTSIMLTVTGAITRLRIFCASLKGSIYVSMGSSKHLEWPPLVGFTSPSPRNGIHLLKAENGIGSITVRCLTRYMLCTRILALAAGNASWLRRVSKTILSSIAPRLARPMRVDRAGLTTLIANASSAGKHSLRINTVHVKSVNLVSHREGRDVYCLTIPEFGCFKLSSKSPIVSNCDSGGYFIYSEYPLIHNISKIVPLPF